MVLIIPTPQVDLSAPVIFLDIDGVLNHLNVYGKREPYINRDSMNCLNVILDETGANIVISSAWRYLITEKLMTLAGFQHMLMTHGLGIFGNVIGKTAPDESVFGNDRYAQIKGWLAVWPPRKWGQAVRSALPWIAIDDTPMVGLPPEHVVYTDPRYGLKSDGVVEAIAKIKQQMKGDS